MCAGVSTICSKYLMHQWRVKSNFQALESCLNKGLVAEIAVGNSELVTIETFPKFSLKVDGYSVSIIYMPGCQTRRLHSRPQHVILYKPCSSQKTVNFKFLIC